MSGLVGLLLLHPDTVRADVVNLCHYGYIPGKGGRCGSYSGSSPLCIAVSQGDLEMVKLLLECGANPNVAIQNKTEKGYPRNPVYPRDLVDQGSEIGRKLEEAGVLDAGWGKCKDRRVIAVSSEQDTLSNHLACSIC